MNMAGKDGSADPLIIGFQKIQSPDVTPVQPNAIAGRSYGAMQPQHVDPYPTAFDNPGGSASFPPGYANPPYPVLNAGYEGSNLPPTMSYPMHPTSSSAHVSHIGFEPLMDTDPEKPIIKGPSLTSLSKHQRLKVGDMTDHRATETAKYESLYFRDGQRKIDYVLAFEKRSDKEEEQKRAQKRESFEKNLKRLGLELEREDIADSADGKTMFVKVHCPWDLLCRGAEEMLMKMPIKEKDKNTDRKIYLRIQTDDDSPDELVIVTENDIDYQTITDRFYRACHCCPNPFQLDAGDIPDELNCFTCAFKRDREDKFIFPENKMDFFSNAQRSRIVHRILMKCRYDDRKSYQVGISRLIANESYTAAFPLHEGPSKRTQSSLTHKQHNDRQLLWQYWARPGMWYKEQPLDLVRKYFGEKIGLYFTWLGFYTTMLIPAAIVGLINIIYGLATMNTYPPILDLCDRNLNFPMCPKCDNKCSYWQLATESCLYSKVAYIIDNPFTVVFAIFMSLWATIFLEFWKRKQSEVQYDWDLLTFEDEEEQPRPEFEATVHTTRENPITKTLEPYLANYEVCPRYTAAFSVMLMMIILVIIAILSVVVYRVAVYAVLASTGGLTIGWAGMIATATAATINLIIIMLLNKIYERLAYILTRWEMPKTQTMFDDLFTFKMYLFQFVNFYGSLFYIAFFKLDPGSPHSFNRILGKYRREECNPAGCLFELGIQLCIIMVGKQIFNNFVELIMPEGKKFSQLLSSLKNWWRRRDNIEEDDKRSRWEKDYDLVEMHPQGLFYEYLEMVIQFGFITIFIAAFPLGPLFALINNLIEIRVDAFKFVTVFRRPLAHRAQDIGIWYEILVGIGKISVIVNALVIGFVSEFVPRLYYHTQITDGSMEGYMNFTLSCYDIRDYSATSRPNFTWSSNDSGSCGMNMPMCRYRGFYNNPYTLLNGNYVRSDNAYSHTTSHWHIIASKLAFVVCFEHFVFAVTSFIAWVIPDVPAHLHNQIKRENFLAREATRAAEVEYNG